MWTGYLHFNNTELANNERVLAYLAGDPMNGIEGLRTPSTSFIKDCGCLTARPLFCDQGSGPDGEYVSPEEDDAPWYDPAVPESAEFAGLFVEDIVGFDANIRREVREGAIGGGSLGPLKLGSRSITVTGWLRAKTCCAAEYGLRWLTEALVGNAACSDCKLGDLYMLKCCPDEEDTVCHVSEVSETQLVTSFEALVAVDDLGGGSYRISIDDPDQTLVVSNSLGALNNLDGFVPSCLDGSDPDAIVEYKVTADEELIQRVFQIPYKLVTAINTAPSGDGALFEVDVDLSGGPDDCPDVQVIIDGLQATIDQWLFDFTPAVFIPVENFSQGRCLTELAGPDPLEFARLFHRTGLVDGPKVLDRRGTCCTSRCGCVNIRVQFTLTSELPYIFSEVDWCLLDSLFPRDEVFCNPLDWCDDCSDSIGTQTITREIPRPECQAVIRYDGTWCPQGWDPDEIGFLPEDCLIVPSPESFDPTETAAPTTGEIDDPCLIDLNANFTWDPVNFDPTAGWVPEFCTLQINSPNGDPFSCDGQDLTNCETGSGEGNVECNVTLAGAGTGSGTWTATGFDPATDGFPPPGCSLVITNGTPGCTDPDTACPVRLVYNVATNAKTWETLSEDSGCDCYVVAETCIEGSEICLVRVIYDVDNDTRTWEPIRWDGDVNNAACTCFLIADIVTVNDNDCPPANVVECPVFLYADGTYDKIGWSWTEADGVFPPAECNITIANDQDTGPINEDIEIPSDLFVPDCGPFPIVPPDAFAGFTSCYCEPWATFRACCTFDNPFQWNEATSFIQVKAGSRQIRNMKIEAYRNPWAPQGVACPCDPNDSFWECKQPCATVLIPQLPSGSTITIDSRTRIAEVTFAGGKSTNGLRYIESANGAPFDWFDVSQCAQLCIVVSADCTTIAEDATVSVGFASRYLASGW